MNQSVLIILMVVAAACNFSKSKTGDHKNQSPEDVTEFSFNTETHNFGKLVAGEIIVFTFIFTNTGDHNLFIKNVKTDCGCVNANYTKEPVKPGEKGTIEVEFDSSGLFGNQFKTIIAEANVPEPKHLAIFAEVENEQLDIKY